MAIKFFCPNGHQLTTTLERVGKPGKCPKCGTTFVVPVPDDGESGEDSGLITEAADAATSIKPEAATGAGAGGGGEKEDVIVFLCPNGHKLNGPASLQGKPGQCPHCGEKFQIPVYDDYETAEEEAEAEVSVGEFGEGDEEEVTDEESGVVEDIGSVIGGPAITGIFSDLEFETPQEALSLFQLVCWFWDQRSENNTVEIHFREGEPYKPDLFAPNLSTEELGVFAVQEQYGAFTLTTIKWQDVVRIHFRNVKQVPEDMFY